MKKNSWPGIIQCLSCKKVLVSNYRHDFQQCRCINETFIDGGYDCLRYGGKSISEIRVLKLSVAYKRRKK